MKLKHTTLIFLIFLSASNLSAQSEPQDTTHYRFFIGSSLFMLANFTKDSPQYYRLDLGYRLTPKDAVILQPITWAYHAPLGIPYGNSLGAKEEDYPGSVRSFGVGVGYNRTLWKGLFLGAYVNPLLVNYYEDKNKIQSGFQLFLQMQLDYHIEFFKKRFYLEPGITFNFWPITTNMPESFKTFEDRWPNYFLFEPVMNFGINF